MVNPIKCFLALGFLVLLTACGGGGSNGGNNSQSLREARTLWSSIAHNNGVKEEYTLEFTTVDAAISASFTLYIWNAEFVPPTSNSVLLDVQIYADGGTPESCSPALADNTVLATCVFTTLNNANQLNLDITNNSGDTVSYNYIFLPGTTPTDGSQSLPFRIPNSVIHDTDVPVTAGIVGGAASSSYYVVNTGTGTTSLSPSQLIAVLGDNFELDIEMFSDSGYSIAVDECTDGSCAFYNLTANTDYYLKVTNNGTGASNSIIYQLDLTPGNDVYEDNGINVEFSGYYTYDGEAYSVYMFDSNGVAVAGIGGITGTMPAGGTTVKLKTLDSNGCITAIDAARIDAGTYTFVSSIATIRGTTEPSACATDTGYLRAGIYGDWTMVDMSTIYATSSISMNAIETVRVGLNADSSAVASTDPMYIGCNVYDANYLGTDDKYRLGIGWIGSVTAGVGSQDWIGISVPQYGRYRIRCQADVTFSDAEEPGDGIFDSIFYTYGSTPLIIEATSGWTVVPAP